MNTRASFCMCTSAMRHKKTWFCIHVRRSIVLFICNVVVASTFLCVWIYHDVYRWQKKRKKEKPKNDLSEKLKIHKPKNPKFVEKTFYYYDWRIRVRKFGRNSFLQYLSWVFFKFYHFLSTFIIIHYYYYY